MSSLPEPKPHPWANRFLRAKCRWCGQEITDIGGLGPLDVPHWVHDYLMKRDHVAAPPLGFYASAAGDGG